MPSLPSSIEGCETVGGGVGGAAEADTVDNGGSPGSARAGAGASALREAALRPGEGSVIRLRELAGAALAAVGWRGGARKRQDEQPRAR